MTRTFGQRVEEEMTAQVKEMTIAQIMKCNFMDMNKDVIRQIQIEQN